MSTKISKKRNIWRAIIFKDAIQIKLGGFVLNMASAIGHQTMTLNQIFYSVSFS